MAASDFVDENTPVFTEAEVYLIGGFLAERWDNMRTDDESAEDIEEAIQEALNYGR
jgi:hypothetical protein